MLIPSLLNVKFNVGGTFVFSNTYVDPRNWMESLTGGGTFIFSNTYVDLRNWMESLTWVGLLYSLMPLLIFAIECKF